MRSLFFIFVCILIVGRVTPAYSLNYPTSYAHALLQIQDTSLVMGDTIVVNDTLKRKSDIDSVIYAGARDSLVFYIKDKKMELYGAGDIKNKGTQLQGGLVYLDFDKNELQAFGVKDTVKGVVNEMPVLYDKGEKYNGDRMRYNFKTGRGFITYAATEGEEQAYSGAKINKMDRSTYFIENGFYTTCDHDHPHYGFFCFEMKVVPQEQVMGRWIFLTFEGVPVPIPIPFAVFPIESGRRSGLIVPSFGNRADLGRYLQGGGYFWAINDYVDLAMTGDYFMRGGYGLNGRVRYNKRYSFTGELTTNYRNTAEEKPGAASINAQEQYRVFWSHNQTIDPTSRLDANLTFISTNYLQQTSTNYNDLLRQDITSNVTYNKSWEDWGASLTANYSRSQNIGTGDLREELPYISFSKTPFYPFRRKQVVGQESWYEKIGINYNGTFLNRRETIGNSLNARGGFNHSISTSLSPKIGFFSVSPSISYNEKWYNKRIVQQAYLSSTGTDSIVTTDKDELSFVRSFDVGVSANTKIYGMFPINSLGIAAVRHILTPRVGYSYRPDFSQQQWGYFDSYTSTTGQVVQYDKFQKEVFGGSGSGESQSINFGIDNAFELKTLPDRTDTTAKEQKIQLLNLSVNASYNFAADSIKFSPISLSYRTRVGEYLNISGGGLFTLYDRSSTGQIINTTLAEAGKGFVRLTNFDLNLGTTFSGERSKDEVVDSAALEMERELLFQSENDIYRGIYRTKDADFTIPWSFTLNYRYNMNRDNPAILTESSSLSGGVDISITKNWKFSVTGAYDLKRSEFLAPQVSVSRDLHCWIMNFTWNPIGFATGYQLEIRVKAPQLRDLKLEKSDRFFDARR